MNQGKIGKFISYQRKECNMTQVQFAEKLGVTNKAVSKWETGKCLPDVSLFSDICLLLNCTLNEFFAGEKIPVEQIEKKVEENLISMALKCQTYNPKITILGYITALLAIICISINIGVGGVFLDGSPVISNLIILIIFCIALAFFIGISYEDRAYQSIVRMFSLLVFISSVISFVLTFWDVSSNIVYWFAIPCQMLFYGVTLIFNWELIYIMAMIISALSYIQIKHNLKKIDEQGDK